jgi:hypothetical protein
LQVDAEATIDRLHVSAREWAQPRAPVPSSGYTPTIQTEAQPMDLSSSLDFVPLRSRTSRRTQSKGMSAGTSTVDDFPLTFNVNDMVDQLSVLSSQHSGGDAARLTIDPLGPGESAEGTYIL